MPAQDTANEAGMGQTVAHSPRPSKVGRHCSNNALRRNYGQLDDSDRQGEEVMAMRHSKVTIKWAAFQEKKTNTHRTRLH